MTDGKVMVKCIPERSFFQVVLDIWNSFRAVSACVAT